MPFYLLKTPIAEEHPTTVTEFENAKEAYETFIKQIIPRAASTELKTLMSQLSTPKVIEDVHTTLWEKGRCEIICLHVDRDSYDTTGLWNPQIIKRVEETDSWSDGTWFIEISKGTENLNVVSGRAPETFARLAHKWHN